MKTKNVSRFSIFARLAIALGVAAMMASPLVLSAQDPGYNDSQQGDPPSIVGRLSVLQGNVSLQSAGVQDFSAAELNYPLTTGDRLYTDNGARGEVQAGQLSVRLGAQTDFTVTSLTYALAQFGLAQGSVHLRSFSFDPTSVTEVDTPNATVSLMSQGDFRIDVYPQDNVTVVTVLQGQAHIDADGVQQNLQQGQSLQVSGLNPSRAQFVGRQRADDLDRFSAQQDVIYQQAFASEGSFVNPETVGAEALAGYGDWDSSADYGPVWYPRNVDADWAPYSNGHWVNIAPWGWTWVGAEPWGFAPYHYGRWARFGNRWGWVPGPQVVRPVYSPALVAFVGGPTFSKGGFSITLGGGGVAAWFPLGPREVYHPWYRSSDRYVNRVNVSNIYNRNQAEVRSVYNNRTNVYANAQVNYANRSGGTVAVSQRDFGSGRQVRGAAVRVDQRQYQNAPVLNRPPVEAQQQQQGGGRPPARALPPRGVDRPVLDSRGNGNPNAPRAPRDGYNGGRPGQQQNPAAEQPHRGNNGQPAPGAQGAPNGYNNGGRGQDDRYNNGRGAQPGQAAPVQPGQTAPPVVDNGRRNDGRYNNGRGQQQGQTAPVQPGQTAPPVVDNGRGNDGRYNNGRGAQPGQTAPVQPGQTTAPVVQTPPVVNGGRGNDGRFNNGRNPGQPNQASPTATQPVPQTPATVPNNPNDSARPGPRRQAPDAPVQMDRQPQQQQQQEQQRQQQLQQQQIQQRQQQEQQRQQQLQQQQPQQQQQEQQRQQQLQQQQLQQQQVQQRQQQEQQRQQQVQQQQSQQQQEQQRQQQLQQQQLQQQQIQQRQQQEQQRQQQLQQQQSQQQQQQQEQQRQQQRQQREAQPATPRPAPPQQAVPPAQQPPPQQPRPQQQAAPPERHQPPQAKPVTPPDDKKKE